MSGFGVVEGQNGEVRWSPKRAINYNQNSANVYHSYWAMMTSVVDSNYCDMNITFLFNPITSIAQLAKYRLIIQYCDVVRNSPFCQKFLNYC